MTMKDFEIPRTVFHHLTDDEISRMVAQQKLHANMIKEASSRLSTHLCESSERSRTTKRKILQHRIENNTGIPFSVTSTLGHSEQLSLLYKMFKHKAHLHAIRNRTNQLKLYEDSGFLQWNATQRLGKEKAYAAARKRHLGINYQETKKLITPRAPTTKKKSHKPSIRSKRASKNMKIIKKTTNDMQSLIEQELERMKSLKKSCNFSRTLKKKPETSRSLSKTQFSKTSIRRIHSARKHTSRKSKSAQNQSDQSTLLDELLQYTTTKQGGDRLGATLPEFRRSIMQQANIHSARMQKWNEMLNKKENNELDLLRIKQNKLSTKQLFYIHSMCKGNTKMMKKIIESNEKIGTKSDIRNVISKLYLERRPQWDDSPPTYQVKKRNIATLRVPDKLPTSSTRLKRIAYDNVISRILAERENMDTPPVVNQDDSNSNANSLLVVKKRPNIPKLNFQ